jgi:carboxymethylenebutenolidase
MKTGTKTSTHTIKVAQQCMALHVGQPPAAERSPAIVVIMHAPGVETFIHSIVGRLGTAGYVSAAPDLYHRQDGSGEPLERMARLKDVEVIQDVTAAVDFLCRQPTVDPERVAIMGFCMGGRVAYLMAAAEKRLKAAVVYYGGNIMKSWGEGAATPFAQTAEIDCPILFHFGEEDANPSPADRVKLDEELTRLGKTHEFFTYPKAGHAFMNFTNSERYREAASEASWPRTIDFLSRSLRR